MCGSRAICGRLIGRSAGLSAPSTTRYECAAVATSTAAGQAGLATRHLGSLQMRDNRESRQSCMVRFAETSMVGLPLARPDFVNRAMAPSLQHHLFTQVLKRVR